MRIGIFGGTFNPIHLGHLAVAEEIREVYRLDRILFIPAARPPHKGGQTKVTPSHRLAMVRQAVQGNHFFMASDLELRLPTPSYSVHTVAALQEQNPRAQLYFLLGLDAFLELDTWYQPERILRLCHFIIIARPGHHFRDILQLPFRFRIAANVVEPLDTAQRTRAVARLPGGQRLYLIRARSLDISASDIRRRLRTGRSVKYLLPEPVLSYIIKNKLYLKP